MGEKSYAPKADEKATQVMLGTADMLLWGDLVTKEHLRIGAFLTTLAEDFVPLHDAKILFLAPVQQTAPVDRPMVYVKLEEILLFYSMSDPVPLPEETEVRRFEPIEVIIGSFQVEGTILKSPMTSLENLLLVSKDAYLSIYQATVRHVSKPWLGGLTSSMVQVRRERLTVMAR
jgi:hypothetical protein